MARLQNFLFDIVPLDEWMWCGVEWSIIILDVVESVVNACKIPNIFFMVASKLIGTYFGHLLLFI